MAYQGYLLKIGTYVVPTSIIGAENYFAYVNMQDYEPWTDNEGYLHREPVELKALKVEFSTRGGMTNTEFADFMDNIRQNFLGGRTDRGRECNVTAYIPEYDSYVTQKGYLSDFQPEMYFADENKIIYKPIRMSFIGGVAA